VVAERRGTPAFGIDAAAHDDPQTLDRVWAMLERLVRPVPLAPQVVAAIRRQLPAGSDPGDLVFTVPGTHRDPLLRHLVKHVYQNAAASLTNPARGLPSTVRRVLNAVRADGR
jgi:hypothetical protein